jgi:hypothetical protein
MAGRAGPSFMTMGRLFLFVSAFLFQPFCSGFLFGLFVRAFWSALAGAHAGIAFARTAVAADVAAVRSHRNVNRVFVADV